MNKKNEIEVSFTEKLILNQLMPIEDSHINLLVRRDLLKKLELDQEDYVSNEYAVSGSSASWNDRGIKSTVSFTNPEVAYLKEKLVKIEKEKKLSYHLVDFYGEII